MAIIGKQKLAQWSFAVIWGSLIRKLSGPKWIKNILFGREMKLSIAKKFIFEMKKIQTKDYRLFKEKLLKLIRID